MQKCFQIRRSARVQTCVFSYVFTVVESDTYVLFFLKHDEAKNLLKKYEKELSRHATDINQKDKELEAVRYKAIWWNIWHRSYMLDDGK